MPQASELCGILSVGSWATGGALGILLLDDCLLSIKITLQIKRVSCNIKSIWFTFFRKKKKRLGWG
jgi:hypothetical protein